MKHRDTDTETLDAALRSWQAPSPSPWLKTRVAQHLARQASDQRAVAWPMAPFKLVTAGIAAGVLGMVLGFAGPVERGFTLEDVSGAEMDTAMDVAIGDAGELDGDEMIDVMW